MEPTTIDTAREEVLSAALRVVSSRIYRDSHQPGPYDDAEAELNDDILTNAVTTYATLLMTS